MPARPRPLTVLAAVALAAAGASLGAGGTGPVAALTGSSAAGTAPADGARPDVGQAVDLTGGADGTTSALGTDSTADTAVVPGERVAAASSRAGERLAPAAPPAPAALPALPTSPAPSLTDQQARVEEVRAEAEARHAEEAARAEAQTAAAAETERVIAAQAALADPRGVARTLAAERGWGEQQFTCLDRLWTRESSWQWDADNPTSSAYGIPQSLPGTKMASAGPDWQTNPATQIRWGLGYIGEVYGTPCGAWAKSQSVGWY